MRMSQNKIKVLEILKLEPDWDRGWTANTIATVLGKQVNGISRLLLTMVQQGLVVRELVVLTGDEILDVYKMSTYRTYVYKLTST